MEPVEASVRWPDRMNASDALLWALDALPELRSTIGVLLVLEATPDPERVHAEFVRLAASLPRLRQRVLEAPFNLAPPEWVDDPQFDLDYHVRTIAVPAPGGMAELLAELGPLYSSPLDRQRPLWEIYLAEGLADDRSAVFAKIHHCLMDGVGGSLLFGQLLGERDARETTPARGAPPGRPRSTAAAARLWRAVEHDVSAAIDTEIATARALLAAAVHPFAAVGEVIAGLRSAQGFGQELVMPRAESPLHQQRSLSRQLATFDMQLGEIDAVRAAVGATNNDVVLTVVSGALHRWHTSRGADVHELRALVPVNLRAATDDPVGNRIALLAVGLPIGEPNPLRRLRAIQDRMGRVKRDRRARLYPLLARLLTMLPASLAAEVGRQQTTRTNLVCTNVPGPRHPCYLAGERIERIYPYAPLLGDHPVSIALYSYRDTMHVGLDVDPLAMDDLPRFQDALAESYDEVMRVGSRPGAAFRRPA
jgi:diacylglycerol O-acyltransferase / wax synthase